EAAAAQHEPALGSSLGGDLGGEPGGADAGRTRQEDEGAAAVEGAVHHHPDVPSLLVAVDEAVGGGHDPWDLLDLTRQDLMQTPAVGEALELEPAAEVELDLGHRPDELANDVRDEDLSTLGLAGDPGREVDRGAEDVARLFDHL